MFNEAEVVPLLCSWLRRLLNQLPCPSQVVVMNTGSSDSTIVKLRDIALADRRFEVLSLARNFGYQVAATAGIRSVLPKSIGLGLHSFTTCRLSSATEDSANLS